MSAPVGADRDPGGDEPTVLRAQIAALEAQLVALTQLPLLVLRIDRQLRAIYVSPAVEQLTARPAAAVLGEPIHALGLPADLVERWAASLTTVFATGQPAQISFAVPSAAGLRHYDARLIPETAPDGTVGTVLVSAYDVTDRAATLHANAEQLDLILRHLPITFFAQDADLRYTWITNPQLGFLTEEVLGKSDSELLPTASAASLAALKRTVLEQGVGMHTEVSITRAGDERLYDLTIEPIRDAAGAPGGVLCAALDITERQQLETQLHHHQALLQSLVSHAPAIIAVKDLAGRFLLVNQQLATALGREPASLLNQTVDDLFPPAIAAAMRANDQQVLRTSQPLEVEESILIGGEQHTQLAVLFPIVDALGAPSALGLVATDITARKRAEEALRASEVRQAFLIQLNDTLRSLADPLVVQATACRLLGEYLGVNAVTYADIDGDEFILRPGYVQDVTPMLGRGPLAGFGATLLEAYRRGETIAVADTSTDERFTAEERAAFQVSQIAAFTGVVLIKAARWVGLFGTQSATPRTWTDAEVALIEAVAQRIWAAVEHARAEEALRESEARLAAFMEYAPGSVFIKDAVGRYVIVNHAFLTDSGKRADEVLGKTDAEIFSQDLVEMFEAEDQAVRMSGTPRAFEETFVYQGQQYTFLSHKFPLPGGSVGCFGADISARKAADDALHELQARRLADEQQHVARVEQLYTQEQAARAQAEAASRLKDEFLATVSHELRTPLTAFLGYAQLLQRRIRDDDPIAHTVTLMVQSAKAQAALIEGVFAERPEKVNQPRSDTVMSYAALSAEPFTLWSSAATTRSRSMGATRLVNS